MGCAGFAVLCGFIYFALVPAALVAFCLVLYGFGLVSAGFAVLCGFIYFVLVSAALAAFCLVLVFQRERVQCDNHRLATERFASRPLLGRACQ